MPTRPDRTWARMWKENPQHLRDRVVEWRRQPAVVRLERPSRPIRARRLGYKAKQGVIVVRMRVGTGGMRRKRPRGGRRPKHLGVTRIKADVSMRQVAERRAMERHPNMRLLGSYYIYKDGAHYWFEVIMADPEHPRVAKDPEMRRRVVTRAA